MLFLSVISVQLKLLYKEQNKYIKVNMFALNNDYIKVNMFALNGVF